MSTAVLVPLTMFLLNESTRELYVLPAEAAAKLEGAKPCVSIRNTFGNPVFSAQTLNQMCAYLAQQTLPRLTSSIKTTLSSDHGAKVAMTIRNLIERSNARESAPVWPPDLPFSVAGLSQLPGAVVLFGVKAIEQQQAILERVDVWANLDGQFKRTYWSRSIQDPNRFQDPARVIQKLGVQIRRTWAAPASASASASASSDSIQVLVDKRVSGRELSLLESVVSSFAQGKAKATLSPVAVRKDGIVYRTYVGRDKLQELQGKIARDFPGFKVESLADGPADLFLKFSGSR